MGTGSRPFETPQTSRSRSHPDICPTKGAGGRVSQPGRGRGGTLTRQTRASRGSRPAAGWAFPPGTPAASCQPGLARNRDTLLLETRPPHRSARRELENRLLPGEERRLPARWSAKPPLGRRLWATAKRQRCHGCWKKGRPGGICGEPQGDARPGAKAVYGGG